MYIIADSLRENKLEIETTGKILKEIEISSMGFFTGIIRRFNSVCGNKGNSIELFNYILKNDALKEGRKILLKKLVNVDIVRIYTINKMVIEFIKNESHRLFNSFKGIKTHYCVFI